jgi:methionine synthase II (cobalamin-independent)
MMSLYRAEVVGSLLRPAWLKDARAAWQQGTLSPAEFKRIEDRAVDAAVAQQEAIGVDVITDGELRRTLFLAPLTETVDGFGPTQEVIEPQRHWRTPSGPYVPAGPPQGFAVGVNCGVDGWQMGASLLRLIVVESSTDESGQQP